MTTIANDVFELALVGRADCLWTYRLKPSGAAIAVAGPRFHIDGRPLAASFQTAAQTVEPRTLRNGATEYVAEAVLADDADLALELVFRVAEGSPVVRFRYALKSRSARTFTKPAGRDELCYLALSLADLPDVKEVRFSEFDEMLHSFRLSERAVDRGSFDHGLSLIGPMLVAGRAGQTLLAAYEHGSTVPDAFIEFALAPDRRVELRAAKGNYTRGQALDREHPFRTIWLELGAVDGDELALAKAYRTFVLRHLSESAASRCPHIFYNTWAFQERNKWWNGKAYLDSMNETRILAEIDAAHRMGIDVFVLDTGWYEKTGDWRVNLARFPDGLKTVKAKLDAHGMKLGLWFDPCAAAVSSRVLREHPDCIRTWGGVGKPHPIWETEASHAMCLVSDYADAFADELIRLTRELGVTYFKWDAVGQYGCDHPGHRHGDAGCMDRERLDRYAFELVRAMAHVAERVSAACPDAIIDFDVTEGGRCVGLAWLAAGKYFLINNGPYCHNFNVPCDRGKTWSNIFVHPGPARTWFCRAPLTYDKWLPSVLFLTHYLPDDPADSQLINLASLILGQNGIWGDLLAVSPDGVERFATMLGLYKQVRDDLTESFPVRAGGVAGNPEIHEKISERTGRGAVVLFATAKGRHTYITANAVDTKHWHTDGVSVTIDNAGRARIDADFARPGAQVVFFGVSA